MKRILLFFLMGILIVVLVILMTRTEKAGIELTSTPAATRLTMFPYQCIDTMKISRDKARSLANDPKADALIATQVHQIAALGANCVAIGTPYDDEFLPYMQKWVAAARKEKLAVWFRGNWAGWEGWFSYPKTLTPEEHTIRTEKFITTHPDLFQNGDIFSPAVEPENGGPFHPVNTDPKRVALRTFLREGQITARRGFASINKDVITEWISMSGGVAKFVFDQQTADSLNKTVTLDHYVASKEGMAEYISLFAEPLQSKVVLGEFGAPIPDINGAMTEAEQNSFVDELLWQLFLKRNDIAGVNYWTFSESSTALVRQNGEQKPVAETLRKYYVPGKLTVIATNDRGKAIPNTIITLREDDVVERTDANGKATILLPQGDYSLRLVTTTGKLLTTPLHITGNNEVTVKAVFPGH